MLYLWPFAVTIAPFHPQSKPMRGNNPIRPPTHDDGHTLDVQEIVLTLQGEGPHAGTRAVFVRLGGCNLACDFCDTEFERFSSMPVDAIVESVVNTAGDCAALVVLTGGEPLRQNSVPLCQRLIAKGLRVQIETNGTLFRPMPEGVEIVCSPKPTAEGYAPIRPDLWPYIVALKFLVSASHPRYRSVPPIAGVPVYVQPMDEMDPQKNTANLAFAQALVLTHGYRLSLQLHKILEIP